jgi:hypothetical protein
MRLIIEGTAGEADGVSTLAMRECGGGNAIRSCGPDNAFSFADA